MEFIENMITDKISFIKTMLIYKWSRNDWSTDFLIVFCSKLESSENWWVLVGTKPKTGRKYLIGCVFAMFDYFADGFRIENEAFYRKKVKSEQEPN